MCGFATLESAMIVTALFAVALGVLALVDYLNRTEATYRSLDREIHNSRVKSLAIVSDSAQEEFALRVNEAELRRFVDRVSERLSGSAIEVGYTVAEIDPTSGALQGVRPTGYRAARGGVAPRATSECPGLNTEGARFAEELSAQVPSNLAVPDGGTSQIRYLSEAVLIIARAQVDLSDAPFTRRTISLLGINPQVTVCAVTALRGEVSTGEIQR